jgi:hypothetical protein
MEIVSVKILDGVVKLYYDSFGNLTKAEPIADQGCNDFPWDGSMTIVEFLRMLVSEKKLTGHMVYKAPGVFYLPGNSGCYITLPSGQVVCICCR